MTNNYALGQRFVLLSLLTGCASEGAQDERHEAPADAMTGGPQESSPQERVSDAHVERPGTALSEAGLDDDSSVDNGGCAPAIAQGNAPTIDDFGDADATLPSVDGRAGGWFFYDDATEGTRAQQFEQDDSGNALHVTSSEFSNWGSGLGTFLSPSSRGTLACPYDAAVYGGLRFRAKGTGQVRLRLSMPESTPVVEGGKCMGAQDDCYDWAGVFFDLQLDWRQYEFPFCMLHPEGWSSKALELDPSQLSAIHFLLPAGPAVDLWLDDLQFTAATQSDAGGAECALPCPLQAAPTSAVFAPNETHLAQVEGLTVHTFEQESVRCGPIERRYLSFVPSNLEANTDAPVVIALHGSEANAESVQELQTRGRLDMLAQRDGAIIVYGNAAPGAHSNADPRVVNSGSWRQAFFDDQQIDDVEYLELVLADLQQRGVTSGDNPIYITGLSNGGGMALRAGRELSQRVVGIAPLMAFDGFVPPVVPDLKGKALTRVLFAYSDEDPGLPPEYLSLQEARPADWAKALGIADDDWLDALVVEVPDVVSEGEQYTGSNEVALATRDSHATQLDAEGQDGMVRLRVLRFDRAGHFWPTPTADTEAWILDRWGFRNQDLDASDALWDFFELGQ